MAIASILNWAIFSVGGRHGEQNLSAVDGEVAGAVDGNEEVGEGGRECQLGAPDVTTW